MTNPNLTLINFVIDKSGSMFRTKDDVIGGFNRLLSEQRIAPGACLVTHVQFADTCTVLYTAKPIADVEALSTATYVPGGNTALLDAIGTSINDAGAKLSAMAEDERPGKVLFVIMTDGLENASREFDRAKIMDMIQHQESKYSWSFLFIGANMDVVQEAASLGIRSFAQYTSNSVGTSRAYDNLSKGVTRYRTSGKVEEIVDSLNESKN